MKPIKQIKRRKMLEHSDECPMPKYTHENCCCHYDDCLNYSGIKYSGCVCWYFTAKILWHREEIRRAKLPFFKRAWIKLFEPFHYWTKYNK